MKESPWTRGLEKYLGNVLMIPYVGTEFAANWPDRYVASLHWSGWIEFKNPNTVLRDAQWLNILELQRFGAMACVVRRTQVRKDYENEQVQIHITNPVRYDAKSTVGNLLPTLADMFGRVRNTTHNYLAKPNFFGEGS